MIKSTMVSVEARPQVHVPVELQLSDDELAHVEIHAGTLSDATDTNRQPGGRMTLPIDSDVDLQVPSQRSELATVPWLVLGVIAAGGALGALGRYGLGVAFPAAPTGFPWATFAINVSGCFLIGVLMALIAGVWSDQRLIRPFLGVGVLGGFTTFSTYVVDIQRLVNAGAPDVALTYLCTTIVAALIAVFAGLSLTELVLGRRTGTASS
jgi:fluoride exporter